MRTTARRRTLLDAFDDPKVRLAAGLAGVVLSALPINQRRVGPREAAAFRAINDLPDRLFAPAWAVMQLGTVGTAPAAAALAHMADDDALATRMLIAGPLTWALSKAVKRGVRRGRPAALLTSVHLRGREASGLGFLSGHAGVAVALGAALASRLGRRGRAALLMLVPVIGVSRMYVGAHLPLDVAGGAALGLAVDAAVELATSPNMRADG